jgi:radical SAM superfamily enzyme YgiQ (UPF0313 family)
MVRQKIKKRILLIFPNYIIREKFGDPTDPPLGIAYIAASLRERDHEVSIIDANAENLTFHQIFSRITKFEPDIIAISCNYSPLHNPTIQLAESIRQKLTIPILVGGNHATAMAEYLLKSSKAIDFIILGEGELTVPKLVESLDDRRLLRDIPGIVYRECDTIIKNSDAPLIENLDLIPDPAYDLLPMHKYGRYNIITSRGCPFNCSYCASNVIFKRRVRYRSPKKVIDEIEHLLKHYGHKQIWFSDDTFTTNTRYTESFLDELIHRSLKITWSCLTRIDVVKKDLLMKMKCSGCIYISDGIESGNQELLNSIGKKITVQEILSTLKITHDVGLTQYGFFIVGFPGESSDTI